MLTLKEIKNIETQTFYKEATDFLISVRENDKSDILFFGLNMVIYNTISNFLLLGIEDLFFKSFLIFLNLIFGSFVMYILSLIYSSKKNNKTGIYLISNIYNIEQDSFYAEDYLIKNITLAKNISEKGAFLLKSFKYNKNIDFKNLKVIKYKLIENKIKNSNTLELKKINNEMIDVIKFSNFDDSQILNLLTSIENKIENSAEKEINEKINNIKKISNKEILIKKNSTIKEI